MGTCTFRRSTHIVSAFSGSVNPFTQGGQWINGLTDATDWCDVKLVNGLACGTQSGSVGPPYNDSTCLLTGPWVNDQEVIATVFTQNQQTGSSDFQEVEIRLRSTLTPNVNNGYEVTWRCTTGGSQYLDIVRWNGPLGTVSGGGGAYTPLGNHIVAADGLPGLVTGAQVRATIIGTVITAYQRANSGAAWTQVYSYDTASDTTKFSSGSPGMGFWLRGAGANTDFGFTDFLVKAA